MSWGYWGIVGGLLAMVTTLFVCIGILYPRRKGISQAAAGGIDDSHAADTQAAASYRRAA